MRFTAIQQDAVAVVFFVARHVVPTGVQTRAVPRPTALNKFPGTKREDCLQECGISWTNWMPRICFSGRSPCCGVAHGFSGEDCEKVLHAHFGRGFKLSNGATKSENGGRGNCSL